MNRRRRKLAVLAVLALHRRAMPRERLIEMFWGGQPEARARHSLSDAVSHLRRVIGVDAIVTRGASIELLPGRLAVDALELEAAAGRGDWAAVAALRAGPLLAGVVVEGSTSFDEWVSREDTRIDTLAAGAFAAGCDELASRGDWTSALELANRWRDAAPDSARARRFVERARHAVELLDHHGDNRVPGALAALWLRARDATSVSAIVAGDDGARLSAVRALVRQASASGATTVVVRAYAGEGMEANRIAGETVRAMLDAPGLAGSEPAHLAALAALVPEFHAHFIGAHGASAVPVATALRGALESIAYEAPLLLVVENAHLADSDSLQALGVAAGNAAGPVLTLFCCPDHAIPLVAQAVGDVDVVQGDDAMESPRLANESANSTPAAADASGPRRRMQRIVRRLASRPLVALAAAALLLMIASFASGTRQPAILAVGNIVDRTGDDVTGTADVLPEVLATSLARVEGLRVLSRAALYRAMAPATAGGPRRSVAAAARAAGATDLLEGTLYRRGSHLRLELRRVVLSSGIVSRADVAEADDVFALADSITASLADALRSPRPATPMRDVTSTSMVARRLYDAGLRAYSAGQADRAAPLFEAALREDPTFAMAAHYAVHSRGVGDGSRVVRALGLADRATDRERLLIRATWLAELDDPRGTAAAETLIVRYPDEVAGMLLYGRALELNGDFASALTWLHRAVERDSLGLLGQAAICHACSALGVIKSAALFAGSFKVAEDAMRQLASAYREDDQLARLWLEIALVRARDQQLGDAAKALDTAMRLNPALDPAFVRMQIDIRAGRLAKVTSFLRSTRTVHSDPATRHAALMQLVAIQRLQGRHRDAVATARHVRALNDTLGGTFTDGARIEALALTMYEPASAAALFDSLAALEFTAPQFWARNARHRAWMLTHVATALVNSGDTARLAALADSVQVIGARSAYARDQRLHHYVRGLLLAARGDTAGAVKMLRQARYSQTETYLGARLARMELALGRTRDAIRTADAALRGPLDSQNQYESRTELHELLGTAYARVGDSARAQHHLGIVASSWARGDVPWRYRAAAAAALIK